MTSNNHVLNTDSIPPRTSVRKKSVIFSFVNSLCIQCIIIALAIPLFASNTINIQRFGEIILLENGRKKPLDTYARNKLLQYSGKRRISGNSALQWMTRVLLDPSRADFDKVFLINNPDIAQSIGIKSEKKRRYSYAALASASDKIEEYYAAAAKTASSNRTAFDREIIRIYTNLLEYRSIASLLSFTEPNPMFLLQSVDSTALVPPLLLNPAHPPSFFDMLSINDYLSTRMKSIQKLPLDSLSEADNALVAITKTMFEIDQSVGNPPPHFFPFTGKNGEEWLSPWGLVTTLGNAAIADSTLKTLFLIANAYRAGDQSAFDQSVRTFTGLIRGTVKNSTLPMPRLELTYNHLNPFLFTKILLGMAAILSLITLFSTNRIIVRISSIATITAFVICTAGIILRMLIMQHPPVTNLYETFIFVAWSTVIIGMFISFTVSKPIGLLTASLAGFVFMHVAGRYAADGDTLGMLAAVLDSGFWLTTHIITIALGYAGCMGAGFIAHIYLIRRMFVPANAPSLLPIGKAMYGVFAFGLLFTTIGTVTGGMWADQAWGRFWGWDPKENGALLIILWCAIVFHTRRSGRIADRGIAVGAIISSILVMCTWIGVNLLGAGLHSYGFTSSGAQMLIGYCSFEIVFLIVNATGIQLKKR